MTAAPVGDDSTAKAAWNSQASSLSCFGGDCSFPRKSVTSHPPGGRRVGPAEHDDIGLLGVDGSSPSAARATVEDPPAVCRRHTVPGWPSPSQAGSAFSFTYLPHVAVTVRASVPAATTQVKPNDDEEVGHRRSGVVERGIVGRAGVAVHPGAVGPLGIGGEGTGRRQHADQVPVAHAGTAGQGLVVTTPRAEQVAHERSWNSRRSAPATARASGRARPSP